ISLTLSKRYRCGNSLLILLALLRRTTITHQFILWYATKMIFELLFYGFSTRPTIITIIITLSRTFLPIVLVSITTRANLNLNGSIALFITSTSTSSFLHNLFLKLLG